MDTEQLVCKRDAVPTRLRCAHCDAGICPNCMVRTSVGFTCPDCAGVRQVRRSRSRRPGWVLAAAAGVVALAVLVAVSRGRSPSEQGDATTGVDGPQAAVDLPAGAQAMIGEEARDGQLLFVVQDFACDAKPVPPGKLCRLRFTVKNTSGSPALLLGRFQYLVDPSAKTYGFDDGLTRDVPENAGRSITELNVNPDVVVPLVLVFDVPDNVEPAEAQFRGTGRSRLGVNVRLEHRA